MKAGGVYSLGRERLTADQQQALIRFLLALASSLILFKYYYDQFPLGGEEMPTLCLGQVVTLSGLLVGYSLAIWACVTWLPRRLRTTMAAGSFIEIVLITYLMRSTAVTGLPLYLWYLFYVVTVATRYGWLYSILALAASVISFTGAVFLALPPGYSISFLPTTFLGFTGLLLVLGFMFGQISERQLTYQARLAVVNEFRAELAGLSSSREIIGHLIERTCELLNVEHAFFLPAKRGADASEAPGLRSVGADATLLSTFREDGGAWNVEEVIREQQPILTNSPAHDRSIPEGVPAKLGLRNLAAAPLMVHKVPVGVIYAANRKDKRLANSDLQLLDLVATQAAPVIENALLWERLREAATAEERLRIARDLHDNFLQNLAAINIHLERCRILVDKDKSRALEGIERIHQVATRGLAEVRSYLSELRLMGPEPSRFRDAIARSAEDAADRGGFKTHLDIDSLEQAIPPEVGLAAFHILRELLNNAALHSRAQHVRVRVAIADGKLTLEVEDDGVGFDVPRVRAEKASEGHLGLIGVEERARQSDGAFTITSSPGHGTRASAVLSLLSPRRP